MTDADNRAAVAGQVEPTVRHRFTHTYCSQCGGDFGPGDAGFSHCGDHKPKEPKKCSGECDDHTSDPRQVRVRHKQSGTDWGLFWYCDAAIAEDRRRGLSVEDA